MRLAELLEKQSAKVCGFDSEVFEGLTCDNLNLFGFSEITGELQLAFEEIRYEIQGEVERNTG